MYRRGNYYARRLAGGFKVFLTRNLRAPGKKGNLKYRETRHPLESALSTIRRGTTTTRMISALNSRAVIGPTTKSPLNPPRKNVLFSGVYPVGTRTTRRENRYLAPASNREKEEIITIACFPSPEGFALILHLAFRRNRCPKAKLSF